MLNLILFPSSYFNDSKVDEELQQEYEAAQDNGLFDISIFSYDKWFNNNELILTYSPNKITNAIYRGWMMKPEQYEQFYNSLLNHNIKLINTPTQYSNLHIFPNIYDEIKNDTARTLIYPKGTAINIEKIKSVFNKFMIKDYVKSVKGTDFPTYFDSSISQSDFDLCMDKFYNYRGNLFTGGICVKEFLQLKNYGNKTNEYRVYYANNEIATVSRNSGQEICTPLPPQYLLEKYKNLDSRFYTIDFAELEDSSWKIIETGDGCVSGLSDMQDYKSFFKTIYFSFYTD